MGDHKIAALAVKVQSPWFLASTGLAEYVLFNGIFTLFKDGPYAGVPVWGICAPVVGYGALTCYVSYPGSLVLFSGFMFVLAWQDAKAAIPVMAFNVSFGELLFTVATMPTALYPAHDVFNPSYFQPYITSVWLACVFLTPLILQRLGHRLRFDWLFVPWFVVDISVQFWEPYFHTTLWSLGVSDVMIAWQFWVVWRLFGMNKS